MSSSLTRAPRALLALTTRSGARISHRSFSSFSNFKSVPPQQHGLLCKCGCKGKTFSQLTNNKHSLSCPCGVCKNIINRNFSTSALTLSDAKKSVQDAVVLELDNCQPFATNSPYNKYIIDNKLTVTDPDSTGKIVITKTTKGYDVRIQLSELPDEPDETEEDGEVNDEHQEKENEEEGTEEQKEEAEQEQADEENQIHSFTVDLRQTGKESGMRIECLASKEGKLYFERFSFAKSWAEFDKEDNEGSVDTPALDYEQLSDSMQDKIADFLDLLLIDDQLANFVQATALEAQRKKHVGALGLLKEFVKN